jgi:hypothetical protein
VTRAELLDRLRPALDVIGEILVDLVEARMAELRPATAPPDHRALVAAVIAELRGAPAAIESPAPPTPTLVRGPRRDPAPAPPSAEIEARAAAMAARYAKMHGSTLALAAIKHRCSPEDVAREWEQLYPAEKRTAVP